MESNLNENRTIEPLNFEGHAYVETTRDRALKLNGKSLFSDVAMSKTRNKILNLAKDFFNRVTKHDLDDLFGAAYAVGNESDYLKFLINKIYDIYITGEILYDVEKVGLNLNKDNLNKYRIKLESIDDSIQAKKDELVLQREGLEKLKTKGVDLSAKLADKNASIDSLGNRLLSIDQEIIDISAITTPSAADTSRLTQLQNERNDVIAENTVLALDANSISADITTNNADITSLEFDITGSLDFINTRLKRKRSLKRKIGRLEFSISEEEDPKAPSENQKEAYIFFKNLNTLIDSNSSLPGVMADNITGTRAAITGLGIGLATAATGGIGGAVFGAGALMHAGINKNGQEKINNYVFSNKNGNNGSNLLNHGEKVLDVVKWGFPPYYAYKGVMGIVEGTWFGVKSIIGSTAIGASAILETGTEVTKHIGIKPSFTDGLTGKTYKAVSEKFFN